MHISTPAGQATTLNTLIAAGGLITSTAADFKRKTWTFTLPSGGQLAPREGAYFVVPLQVAMALTKEAEQDCVLQASRSPGRLRQYGDILHFDREDSTGVQMNRDRFIPDAWIDSLVSWHPSYWRATETRRDQHGKIWKSERDVYVTGDFGELVRLPEEFQ